MSEDPHASSEAPQPPPEAADASYPTLEEMGHLLPQYEMHAVIGVGGMGAVYKARQAALDRWVAIKLLPVSAAQNEEDARMFIKEARAMARLVHPHIVAVFDFGQTHAGHLYLVMEYVEGRDLHRRTRAKEITPQRAREVIAQLCDALQFAHDHGVAHRDIKPANILITENWKVKVADFGLARELAAVPNTDEPEYGTPDYTAPERMIIGAVVDHRADIYSLGVVIHEMLTGKTPSAAGTETGKGLPPGFAGVISKCLMQEPLQRYQRAADVKIALLSATAENRQAAHAAMANSTDPGRRAANDNRPALAAWAPVLWGLASVVVLLLLGWLVLRNKTQQWDAPVTAGSGNSTARSGDLAVFAPPTPVAPPQTPPEAAPADSKKEPPPPAPPVAVAPAPKPSADPIITPPHTPLEQPYQMPEGGAGEISSFHGHSGAVFSVVLHPDQRRVISGSYDDTVRVWDLIDQRELLRVDAGIGDITRISLSSDGRRVLAYSGATDKTAVLDVETGKTLAQTGLPHDRLTRAIFLPNSEEVLLGGTSTGPNLFRWVPGSGAAPQPIPQWTDIIYEMTPIQGGPEVVVTGTKTVSQNPKSYQPVTGRLNLNTGELVMVPHKLAYVTGIFVTPNQDQAALIGSSILSISTWPALEPVHAIKLAAKQPRPRTVVLADKGRLVVGTWTDNSLRVHETATGEEVYHVTPAERLTDFSLSRDERWAILGSKEQKDGGRSPADHNLVLWRLPKWDSLISDKTILSQAEAQMPDLPTHDAELAKVREELEQAHGGVGEAGKKADLQTLNVQYVTALRREAQLQAPTEQKALLEEVNLIAQGNELPADGVDLFIPDALRRLRGIYRRQLEALKAKQEQALADASQAIEARLKPLQQQRETAGDRVGAARVKLVMNVLMPDAPATSGAPAGNTTAGGPAAPVAVAAGTPTKRPNRPGTVFALPRAALNTGPPVTQPIAGRVPGDLGPAVALAGGSDHVFALLPDGRVRGWGRWQEADVTVPDEVTKAVRVDSSANAAMALREDGGVVVWGPGKPATVWQPPAGKAAMDVCAGSDATGYVLCTDGAVLPAVESMTPPPSTVATVARLFYIPEGGFCAVRRDGFATFWGTPPPATVPGDLRDLAWVTFSKQYAVALQRDGTLIGWGQLAPDQRFRIRKFTGSIAVPHDYAGRLFPVHRGDHAWEMVPNPNVPGYISEDRPAVLEGRLRGSIDAVFTEHYVIGLRP